MESYSVKIFPTTETTTGNLKSSGSGMIISESGIVVTNHHVVNDANNITVSFPIKSATFKADIKVKDINNDLVLLQLKDFEYNKIFDENIPFSFGQVSDLNIGQEVFTLGFPFGDIMGTNSRLSSGRINSLFGINDDPRLLQMGNPLQPGNSGGGLFNSNGELIGVVVSSLNASYFYENLGIIPQNVNFAIKISLLKNLIEMLPDSRQILNTKSQINNYDMEKQIQTINPYVVQVKSSN